MKSNEQDQMIQRHEARSKGWKEFFLRSGVPLEYETALVLAAEGMSVDADFSFLRRDGTLAKESSVDIAARWYGPNPNIIKYELNILVECKYRSPDKFMLFLEEPSEEFASATLGGTVNSFDFMIPYNLPLSAFVPLEEELPYVYKGIELYDRGAVEEDLRYGIQQLRYATPALLRQSFDFGLPNHPSDRSAIYFTKYWLQMLHCGCLPGGQALIT